MADTLTLTIESAKDIPLVFSSLNHLEKRSGYQFNSMHQALKELIENTLLHAYPAITETLINLDITFILKECQLLIHVQEYGEPFDFTTYLSEAIDHSSDHSKGFYHIYDLVDTFYFSNHGKEGKRFTLIVRLDNCQLTPLQQHSAQKKKSISIKIDEIFIRNFIPEDGEAISKLIYQNYDYTYYKPFFYNPYAVTEANKNSSVHSVIAEHNNKVIGHFALVPRNGTNSAEIAIAVVQPNYKGIGIMNKMFDAIIKEAKRCHYRSIFGEAIMLHPYSQKANLKHGMLESALALGLVPSDIEIEHDLKIEQRSGVLISYLLFTPTHHLLNLPNKYKDRIQEVYTNAKVLFTSKPVTSTVEPITIHIDDELNLGAIQIDEEVSSLMLTEKIELLMLEQTDMIYADINLHRIFNIDALVTELNQHGFFYGGVLFDFYHDEDYLRLQKICSKSINTEHLVTYSPYAKALLHFVQEDGGFEAEL